MKSETLLEDRLLRGGFLGSLLGTFILSMDILSYNILHFAKSSWLGILSRIILGHPMRGFGDTAIGVTGHLLFGGILGGIYARFVIPEPGIGNYPLRGAGFGVVVWFATFAVATVFRVPGLAVAAWQTALVQLLAVSGWGYILGWVFARLEERFGESHQPGSEIGAASSSRVPSGQQPASEAQTKQPGQKGSNTQTAASSKASAQPPASMEEVLTGVRDYLTESSDVLKDLREALLRLNGTMEELTGTRPEGEQESWAAHLRHPVNIEDWHPGSTDEERREERLSDRH